MLDDLEQYQKEQRENDQDREIYPSAVSSEGDSSLNEKFNEYLLSGEYVIWSGKGKKKNNRKGPNLVFAIFWTAFSIFWTVGASQGSKTAALFGVPFILIGVFMFISYFRTGNKIIYALTNQRIIQLDGKKITTEYLDKITDAKVYQTSADLADITFSKDTPTESFIDYTGENQFTGIKNAEYVCSLILSEIAKNKQGYNN